LPKLSIENKKPISPKEMGFSFSLTIVGLPSDIATGKFMPEGIPSEDRLLNSDAIVNRKLTGFSIGSPHFALATQETACSRTVRFLGLIAGEPDALLMSDVFHKSVGLVTHPQIRASPVPPNSTKSGKEL
jgi:hypothetical protein